MRDDTGTIVEHNAAYDKDSRNKRKMKETPFNLLIAKFTDIKTLKLMIILCVDIVE